VKRLKVRPYLISNGIMAKIPKSNRQDPSQTHVKSWSSFREKMNRPKAKLASSKAEPLSLERYEKLMEHYDKQATEHLKRPQEKAYAFLSLAPSLRSEAKTLEEREAITDKVRELAPLIGATTQRAKVGHKIVSEIISDFRRTKGLKVFGFGVGYGQLLFFLKKHMDAKVAGVDLAAYSQELTREKKLGVLHGTNASSESLKRLGKFDVTYSSNLFGSAILPSRQDAMAVFDNIAHLTRNGGKSYHYTFNAGRIPLTREEIESKGFRIDKWETTDKGNEIFLKLTKIRD